MYCIKHNICIYRQVTDIYLCHELRILSRGLVIFIVNIHNVGIDFGGFWIRMTEHCLYRS